MNRPAAYSFIAAEIASGGPISFHRFMEIALYHSDFGYYQSNAPGPGGDYQTSPTLSPAFGRLLARQVETMFEALGNPDQFTVVEVGAGRSDLLTTVSGELARSEIPLEWCFVERSEKVARAQRDRLEGSPIRVRWVLGLEELGALEGVILANEVLDNFPVQVFEMVEGRPLEIGVGIRDGELAEVVLETQDFSQSKEAAKYLEEGDRFEVAPDLAGWCEGAASALNRGYLLVVDYGDTEPSLWTDRRAGTLVTYRDGDLGFDPIAQPGQTDITAHVNFSALGRACEAAGFICAPLSTQSDWLETLGLDQIVADTRRRQRDAEAEHRFPEALAAMAERGRIGLLSQQSGLGDFKTLLAAKNAPWPANWRTSRRPTKPGGKTGPLT